MNSKQKANIGIGKAIAYYTSIGAVVSIPLNDSQSYDLLVDFNSVISRVQVKYTSTSRVDLRSVSGSTRLVYNRLSIRSADILFIVGDNLWEIPVADIHQTTAIILNSDIEKYIVG